MICQPCALPRFWGCSRQAVGEHAPTTRQSWSLPRNAKNLSPIYETKEMELSVGKTRKTVKKGPPCPKSSRIRKKGRIKKRLPMSLTLKKYVHRAVRWQFVDPSIFLPLTPPKHAPTPAKVTAKPHNRWQRRQPRQPKQPPVKLELVGMFRLFFSTYLLNYFISFM